MSAGGPLAGAIDGAAANATDARAAAASASVVGLRDRLRARLQHRRLVLSLAHADHHLHLGGVQLYMRVEQQRLDAAGVSFVNLWADEAARIGVNADGAMLGAFAVDEVAETLRALGAGEYGVAAVDIHHLQRWPLADVRRIVAAVGSARVRLFVHDYHLLCANPNLTFGDSCYCGAPPPESQACGLCRFGATRRAHVDAMAALLAALEPEVIAPSPTAAELFLRHYPRYAARTRVVAHQELVAARGQPLLQAEVPRLAFVGCGVPAKGSAAWMRLLDVPEIRARFALRHYGICSALCSAEHVAIDFIRQGHDAMTRALVRDGVDFAFVWSVWPETFSFTVHEAIAAGAYVLTNENSGNVAAQVRASGRGRVFADFDALQRFLFDGEAVAAARATSTQRPRFATAWNHMLADEIAQ